MSNCEGYFVVSSSESGIHIDGPLTQADLLKRITPDAHGELHYGPTGFHSRPPECDGGYFRERYGQRSLLVIKGAVVVPVPKQVVASYEVP